MTFTPPRIPPVFETNRVPDPNDPTVSGVPIGCVQQQQNADGTSTNTPPFGGGNIVRTIGTVTVTGDTTSAVGNTVTYQAVRSGNSQNTTFTFAAPGGTFTGGTVTWVNAAAPATITCTATDPDATDTPQTGTLDVTVNAAATNIGNVTVTGDGGNNRRAGIAQSFTAAADGNAADITWTWTASADGVVTGTGATVTVIWPGTDASRAGTEQTVTATATSPASAPTTANGNTTIDMIPAERAAANVQDIIDSTAFNANREQNLTVQAADFVNQFIQNSAAGLAAAQGVVPGWNGATLAGGFPVTNGGSTVNIPAGGVAYVDDTMDGAAWAGILAAAGVSDAVQSFAGSNGEGCSVSWFLIINQDALDRETDADYEETIRHELLHGLGIGQFWNTAVAGAPPLTADTALDGTVYTETLAAFNAATSATAIDIPVEAATGPGDAGLAVGDHWELDARTVNGVNCPGVTNEIMLGRAADGLVLTQLSISNMVDMGYEEIVAGTVEGALATTFSLMPVGYGAGKTYKWQCVHRDGGINLLN